MALDFDQPKENELLVRYVYDDIDRLILRNVYQIDTNTSGLRGGSFPRKYTRPKKLLYQDLYTYRNSQTPDYSRRVYQPIIAPPTGTRNGSTVSFSTSIICKSTIYGSGFIWRGSKNDLLLITQAPSYRELASSNTGVFLDGRKVFTLESAIGQLNHTITTASTMYIKAFCMIETGILFSRTLEL